MKKIYLLIIIISLSVFVSYGYLNNVWIWKYEVDTSNLVSFPKTIMANTCSDLKFIPEGRCVVIGNRLYTKRKDDHTPFKYIATNEVDLVSISLLILLLVSSTGCILSLFLKSNKS